VSPGDEAVIAGTKQGWPCGSSLEALDEMLRWAGDGEEYFRTLTKTDSAILVSGEPVKVLAFDFKWTRGIRLKVRRRHFYDDFECWTLDKAVTKGNSATKR